VPVVVAGTDADDGDASADDRGQTRVLAPRAVMRHHDEVDVLDRGGIHLPP
jgi:hypothetical protein